MVKILCIGGGITGQLVQVVVPSTVILDWRTAETGHKIQTRRFGANYLWEPLEGLPSIAFPVVTHIDGRPATPESIHLYKVKVGKHYDTILTTRVSRQFETISTGHDAILPDPTIQFDCAVEKVDLDNRCVYLRSEQRIDYDLLISTIPLYALLRMVDYTPPVPFRYDPIHVKIAPRPPDAPYPEDTVYVNYITSPTIFPYRVTDRDGSRHYESLNHMGGLTSRKIVPGKIHPHPYAESIRTKLLAQNVFCFGRFSTWEPKELVHETYRTIRVWADELGLSQEKL
jgi:hypothetical protein